MDREKWLKKAQRPIKLQTPTERDKQREEREKKRERADRRRLEKELKRLGWDSIEHFEADAKKWAPRG